MPRLTSEKIMLLIVLSIWFLLLVIASANAQIRPVEPIARTDELIKQEHQATRDWCQQQWNSKEAAIMQSFQEEKEALKDEAKTIFWWDRVLSFGSLFFAVLLALLIYSWLNKRNERKLSTIQKQEYDYLKKELGLDYETIPEPPSPTATPEQK